MARLTVGGSYMYSNGTYRLRNQIPVSTTVIFHDNFVCQTGKATNESVLADAGYAGSRENLCVYMTVCAPKSRAIAVHLTSLFGVYNIGLTGLHTFRPLP